MVPRVTGLTRVYCTHTHHTHTHTHPPTHTPTTPTHTHTLPHTHMHTHTPSHTHTCTHTHPPTHTHTGPENYSQKGCCWKAFHTDVNGKWWKPHKAGPITAFFLVIGWILFLVLFGWIVGLALILVAVLICFAYIFNFMCTGRCRVEEADEQREATNGTNGNQLPTVTNNASGQTRTGRF